MQPSFYQLQTSENTTSDASSNGTANAVAKITNKRKATEKINIDTIYNRLSTAEKQRVVTSSINTVNREKAELEFRSMISSDIDYYLRTHNMQKIAIFTLSFSCLIFFFIGAPIGAIIRKGGLGLPMIVSVLVFIVYYILDNSGTRMAKIDAWNLWFGCLLSTIVLTPLAIFVTYKANNDAIVFNADAFTERLRRLLGLRNQRHIMGKEVIIEDPDYLNDAALLKEINSHITDYTTEHKLTKLPNIIKVFFKYKPDHEIENISEKLELVIDDLSNTRDKLILTELNSYPILEAKAHTRPFDRRWMNIASAILFPIGIFLYFRMVRFRVRLSRDLRIIQSVNDKITDRIAAI